MPVTREQRLAEFRAQHFAAKLPRPEPLRVVVGPVENAPDARLAWWLDIGIGVVTGAVLGAVTGSFCALAVAALEAMSR
jgi:hypothetical protein